MLKLLRLLRGYLKECITGPLFKLVEVIFELIVPLAVASIIDNGIAVGNTAHIIKMCGVLALFALGGLICAVTAQYFSAKAAVGFAADVRERLFAHIQCLSFSQLDRLGASTLITRLTGDISQVQTGINLTLRLALRSPLVVFGAVIMAFTVDPGTAVVFAAAIPLLAIVIFAVMLTCIPLYRGVQQRLDALLGKTRENLNGTRVVRAFCKEEEEIADFDAKNRFLTELQLKVGKISAVMNPATLVLINFAVIVLIYTGALGVGVGRLSSGDVVAQYNYMSQILIELVKLASLIISITRSVACGNRIQAVLDTEPEMRSGKLSEGKGEYSVEFENVSLSYGGGENALENINFKIGRGESVGIIGSTGSGKTSLVNLIPRFYDVSDGCVRVNGEDVREYDLNSLRGLIGVVSQKKVLFKGTVRENMLMGKPDATDTEIWEALEIAQARTVIEEKPGGLDFVIEQDGKNLSGGQRQRLTIARALVGKPEILILDDAASALDYATAAAFERALSDVDFSPTVITVSQRVAAIRGADTVVVLDEGKIVGKGTDRELRADCSVYAEICDSQLEGEGGL